MRNRWMILFLTLIWCGFSNNFGMANFLFGVFVAFLCCALFPKRQTKDYHIRLWPLICLLGLTILELIKSSLLVAWEVITPKHLSEPKILQIDLACRNDIERTFLANLISLTPGTLSIDLTENKTQLKIHVMFAAQPEKTVEFIKKNLEPKVMKVFKYANA